MICRRQWRSYRILVIVAIASLGYTPGAAAKLPIYEGEFVELELAASARSLAGVYTLGYELPAAFQSPTTFGLGASILRLELDLGLGEHVSLLVHDRLFLRILSNDLANASAVGLGVSTPPQRTVRLDSSFVDEQGVFVNNDLDRLALRLNFDAADFTLGRQAITWGDARLFRVADLWTSFSPFELDLSEKRGVDALRMLTSFADGKHELELLVADRGSVDALSAGLRWMAYLDALDIFTAAAKQWDLLMLMGGVSWMLERWSLRAELAWPAWSLEQHRVELPRATLGVDFFDAKLLAAVELHFNGAASAQLNDSSAALSRGETYLRGRYYAGLLLSWQATELLMLSLSTTVKLDDPSVLLAPVLSYRLGDDAEFLLGASLGFGEQPDVHTIPKLRSEFGAYGQMLYAQWVAYL